MCNKVIFGVEFSIFACIYRTHYSWQDEIQGQFFKWGVLFLYVFTKLGLHTQCVTQGQFLVGVFYICMYLFKHFVTSKMKHKVNFEAECPISTCIYPNHLQLATCATRWIFMLRVLYLYVFIQPFCRWEDDTQGQFLRAVSYFRMYS